ncbi:methyltransferase-like protein 25 isoform X2 [Takifugu flavidus]|uniref:methyltransferase-like protein 25 isoform X2 n=1 Tax=Takifugu flavidus TaxID=433684 RepID=UPI0025446A67|nr:methyltransferase-like protein 25 isoform X2 [Takifugu flavidus]
MLPSPLSLSEIHRRIDEVKRFLSITLSIANAHTVEFYTHDVWSRFMAVEPQEVLRAVSSHNDRQRASEHKTKENLATTFGFCNDTNRLVDAQELLQAATTHSLPGLQVCMSRDELLLALGGKTGDAGAELVPDEFMNSKKSHEVQSMSEVVAGLAQRCGVKQVIDVGSGKGYLSSFLSLQYGLRVYGIDSSTTNTHGAQERNRKLKRFSRAYQKRNKAARAESDAAQARQQESAGINPEEASHGGEGGVLSQEEGAISGFTDVGPEAANSEREDFFLHALSEDLVQNATPRLPPSQLGAEEKERRKRENLERKAQNQAAPSAVFSPLTSHVTAETELGELIQELEVGRQLPGPRPVTIDKFHHRSAAPAHSSPRTLSPVSRKRSWSGCTRAETWRPAPCGCLWPSRSWLQSAAWAAAITCCLSSSARPGRVTTATQTHISYKKCVQGACGFPLSQYLRQNSCFCGRNARMSACLALERVSLGRGIQMESLFFRAVLHVILRERYDFVKSEKRVGNVYSKTKSFVEYVRGALRRLELDESKLSDGDIQGYHDAYAPRMDEMHAFNMLKVALAPCIEGLILLDRLCYLREQEHLPFCALVQLFNPLLSPRCYAVVGLKSRDDRNSSSYT